MSETQVTVKRGRPTVDGSKRQAVLAMRAEKVANGGEIKRGRPASTTPKVPKVKKVKTPKAEIEMSEPV